jgi:hypothetical protein
MFDQLTYAQLQELARSTYLELDHRYDRLHELLALGGQYPHWTAQGKTVRTDYQILHSATTELHETMTAMHGELEGRRAVLTEGTRNA